jgi:hypothetical protein
VAFTNLRDSMTDVRQSVATMTTKVLEITHRTFELSSGTRHNLSFHIVSGPYLCNFRIRSGKCYLKSSAYIGKKHGILVHGDSDKLTFGGLDFSEIGS